MLESPALRDRKGSFVNYSVCWPERALIRLRYHQQPSPDTITPMETGIRITLDTPAALSAPGQIAAVYDPAGRILAGGFITKLF